MAVRLLLACALAGCDPGTDWAGGPIDPGLVHVSLGPSLLLVVIPGGDPPDFGMIWRDTKTGELTYPAPAARITSTPPGGGTPVDARFARWHTDSSVTIFWLRRTGTPAPAGAQPDPPDRYPLVTAYDDRGATIASVHLRPREARPPDG